MMHEVFDLKPCPFCGKDVAEFGTALELEDCANYDDEHKCPAFFPFGVECGLVKIVCNVNKGGCGASTGYSWEKEDAVRKWNGRLHEGDDGK